MLSASTVKSFRKKIYGHYASHRRNLPWRRNVNPYRVLISEIMLQQTQVERVIEKYKEFLAAYPDFSALSRARTAKLLSIWSGLGYNRRALALQSLAKHVVDDHDGKLPREQQQLLALPGIGKYTAGAIMAFAFNLPVVFMDTNIRRVYIHEFLKDREGIHDDELLPLVQQTMDRKKPGTWYNALMDYGAMLKREHLNPNRRSLHYSRQSPFEKSNRQVRGMILRALVHESPLSESRIIRITGMDAESVKSNLLQLQKEGFLRKKGRMFTV